MLRILFLIIVLWHTQTLNHLSLERFFLIRIRHTHKKKEWTKKDIWIANFHLWLRTCYHTAFSHNTQGTQQSYVSFLRNKLWWVWAFRAIDHYRTYVGLSVCLFELTKKKMEKGNEKQIWYFSSLFMSLMTRVVDNKQK